jgi:probable HAF family extracellular repeat protein
MLNLAIGRTLIFAAVLGLSLASAHAQVRYTVAEIGTPVGSSPAALSDTGQTVGNYFAPSGQRRAFRWTGGPYTDIGTLGGIAQAAAVNDAGTIVGYSVDTQGIQRAFKVTGSVMSGLPTLHGGIHANANDVNSAGWIVGMSQQRFGNEQYQRAALWRNGVVTDLGTFGGEYAEAFGVNDAGQVVGWAWYPLPTRYQRAFLWSDATGMQDLGTLGGYASSAADINDLGVVVGTADTNLPNNPQRAFRWTPQSGMVQLPIPPEAFTAYASAVNNAGQIVGNTFLPLECRSEPLLWQDNQMHKLNDLLVAGSGWTVTSAADINDRGIIAGTAFQGTATYRSVLLIPTKGVPTSSGASAQQPGLVSATSDPR